MDPTLYESSHMDQECSATVDAGLWLWCWGRTVDVVNPASRRICDISTVPRVCAYTTIIPRAWVYATIVPSVWACNSSHARFPSSTVESFGLHGLEWASARLMHWHVSYGQHFWSRLKGMDLV